jgi:hypothetical protein
MEAMLRLLTKDKALPKGNALQLILKGGILK